MIGPKWGKYIIVIYLSFTLGLNNVECAFQNVRRYTTEPSVEDALAAWKDIEQSVKTHLENLIKHALPMVMRSSGEVEISDACGSAMLKVLFGLKQGKMWAYEMIDATAKPDSGFFSGTFSSYGDYEECLQIKIPSRVDKPLTGKYCLVEFQSPLPQKPSKVFNYKPFELFDNATFELEFLQWFTNNSWDFYTTHLRIAFCLPSSCSSQDLQNMVNQAVSSFKLRTNVVSCEVKEKKIIDGVQLAVITVLIVFVILVIMASVADTFLPSSKMGGIGRSLVSSFSLSRNTERLLDTSNEKDQTLSCLNGMRFGSIIWVILGHCYLLTDYQMLRSSLRRLKESEMFFAQIIINTIFSVETFFFITGVLIAYWFVKAADEKGFKISSTPVLIMRRIWRLLPSAMLAVGLATLFPLVGEGPLWNDIVGTVAKNCRTNWWQILIFWNNMVPISEQCLIQLWYISVDIQLFHIALIYLIVLYKKPAWALVLNVVLILSSILSNSLITYFRDYPGTPVTIITDYAYLFEMIRHTFYLPNYHLPVYMIGITLGTFLAKNPSFHISKGLQVIGWIAATICSTAPLFGTYTWNLGRFPSSTESSFYAGLSKPSWALSLSWITLMCATGRGGFINSILSWRGYQPLNRLTYLVYVFHLFPYFYFMGQSSGNIDYTHSFLGFVFLGTVVSSFIMAFVFKLIFEGPIAEIEKIFWDALLKKQKENKALGNPKSFSPFKNKNDVHPLTPDKEDSNI